MHQKRSSMAAMAGGAGLYWAASALLSTVWAPASTVRDQPTFYDCLPILVTFAVLCALALAWRALQTRRSQAALALTGIGCFVLGTLVVVLGPHAQSDPLFIVLTRVLQGGQTGCFIAFWGLGFAALSKEAAVQTVTLTLLIAFSLYGIGCLVPSGPEWVLLAGALKSLSTLPFLCNAYPMPVIDREPIPSNQALLKPFFGSRLFFGAAMGVVSCGALFCQQPTPAPSLALSVGLTSLSVLALAFHRFYRETAAAALRVSPLIIAGALALPFLGTSSLTPVLMALSASTVFLCWITLSSVQLSDIKERVGWNEARLSLTEKAVFGLGWTMAFLASFIFYHAASPSAITSVAPYVNGGILYLAAIVACFMMASLIERKEKARILEGAIKLSENQKSIIYEELAREHRLTAREHEILVLLAKGYSRPLICEELVIAESTARSHIKHIYTKLDIHAREELYRIVEAREQRFSSEKSNF